MIFKPHNYQEYCIDYIKGHPVSALFLTMGLGKTVITLTAYTDRPEVLEEGLKLCGEYEEMLSRTIEGSDVWKINHADGKTVTVSDETAAILREAVTVSELFGFEPPETGGELYVYSRELYTNKE